MKSLPINAQPKTGKTISREDVRAERARTHSVSITYPCVIEFGNKALREAFRLWWHPYDMGKDFDALTERMGSGRIVSGDIIERRKLDPGYFRRIDHALGTMFGKKKSIKRTKAVTKRVPVKVLVTLNYPLTKKCSKVVTIDRRYPGEIFALTHDFYRELYAEDEDKGGKAGPSGGLLNRGRGPLVWGHDLGDLAFESCRYRAFDKAMAKKTGAEGEFTFGIGS